MSTIALIQNQLYEIVPIIPQNAPYALKLLENDVIGLFQGTNRIEWGVSFYSMQKYANIDRISGKITRNSSLACTFRVVFGGTHLDITA